MLYFGHHVFKSVKPKIPNFSMADIGQGVDSLYDQNTTASFTCTSDIYLGNSVNKGKLTVTHCR